MENIIEFKKRYEYSDSKIIGEGGFSKVYMAYDTEDKKYVAIKVSEVKTQYKEFTLKREVELVKKLPKHDNIAQYQDCYRFYSEDSNRYFDYAVLKYYEEGNLNGFLKRHPQLDIRLKKIIIEGILEGIKFLHDRHYIHRDLKAQNILLHKEDGIYVPKITDLGLSREGAIDDEVTNSSIGFSRSYAAPEQINGEDKIHRNVDLWAFGVLLYQILTGEQPFKSNRTESSKNLRSQLEVAQKILTLQLPEKLEKIPEPYQTIIRKCLVIDPRVRVQNAGELLAQINKDSEEINDTRTILIPQEDYNKQLITPQIFEIENDYLPPDPYQTQVVTHTQTIDPSPIIRLPHHQIGENDKPTKLPWKWIAGFLALLGIISTISYLYFRSNQSNDLKSLDPHPSELQQKLDVGKKWLLEKKFAAAAQSFQEALVIDSNSVEALQGFKSANNGRKVEILISNGNDAMYWKNWSLAKIKYDSALTIAPGMSQINDSIDKVNRMLLPKAEPTVLKARLIFEKITFEPAQEKNKKYWISILDDVGTRTVSERTLNGTDISLYTLRSPILTSGNKIEFIVVAVDDSDRSYSVFQSYISIDKVRRSNYQIQRFDNGVLYTLSYKLIFI